jgi:hypothetical protein
MAVTGRDILNMALVLIDEVSETGAIQSETPGYYETKALTFLTMVQSELLPPNISPPIITDLDATLLITDSLAIRAASYGVASKIAISEDMNLMVTLNNMYDEMKRKILTSPLPIIDVYEEDVDNG